MRYALYLLPLLFGACSLFSTADETVEYAFDFSEGPQEWEAGFADYPVGEADRYELTSGFRALPSPLDTTQQALYISGRNMSDDLFMFFKRRVTGLSPNTDYAVTFGLTLASDAPSGCVGIGGPPGESVYVKAGASAVEPTPEVDDQDYYRLNVDKGNQSTPGEQADSLGNVANTRECEEPYVYERKTLTSQPGAVHVQSSDDGTAWLFFGTDSGFEGKTSLYYLNFSATFEER